MCDPMDESQLIQTGDLFITKHSNLSYCNTIFTGLVSQKEQKRLRHYMDIISKFLRGNLSYYLEPLHTLYLPLDFILKALDEKK